MKKAVIWVFLVMLIALVACSTSTLEESTTEDEPLAETEFGEMLGSVPYSFLEEHDIWFSNPEKTGLLYGIEVPRSIEKARELSSEELAAVKDALAGLASPDWKNLEIAESMGFDGWMVSQTVFPAYLPPWDFSVNKGDFDEDLITSGLAALGYEKEDVAPYAYYKKYDDFQIDMLGELSKLRIMARMNRVAVLDDTIITAPATDIITGILDTMAGNEKAIMDDPACKSLAGSLGEVLSGVIITPDRVVDPNPGHGDIPPFDFTIPQDWGTLHQYDMLGMGYKDDVQERFWVISLYYNDAEAASADAGELVKRMKSYIFNTQYKDRGNPLEVIPLTDWFEVGEAVVQPYSEGATLTVACRYKPETANGAWLTPTFMLRDLLFLSPEPSLYLGQ